MPINFNHFCLSDSILVSVFLFPRSLWTSRKCLVNLCVPSCVNMSVLVFLILNWVLSWSICCGLLGKVAWVTSDTVLPHWINYLETGETFKCSVVPADAVAQTASVHRWDQISKNVQKKMGGIQNLPDYKLFSSRQPKTKSILSCCCWYVLNVSKKQQKLLLHLCESCRFLWENHLGKVTGLWPTRVL